MKRGNVIHERREVDGLKLPSLVLNTTPDVIVHLRTGVAHTADNCPALGRVMSQHWLRVYSRYTGKKCGVCDRIDIAGLEEDRKTRKRRKKKR